MRKLSRGMLAASAAVLALANPAHAVSVSVGGSIAHNTLLNAGAHAGSFDLSGVLSASAQVTGASYSFTFKDDGNDAVTYGASVPTTLQETGYQLVGRSGGSYGTDYWDYYERDVTQTYSRVDSRAGEGTAVTLGSASVAAGSGSTATTTTTQNYGSSYNGSTSFATGYAGTYYTYGCGTIFNPGARCGDYRPGYWEQYRTNNYSSYLVTLNDPTGTFTVSGSITDAALLAEMNAHQALSFSLGVWGDLVLDSATLTLDINNTVAAVPEPSTFALSGAGLAALAVVARRRRQQGAARFA